MIIYLLPFFALSASFGFLLIVKYLKINSKIIPILALGFLLIVVLERRQFVNKLLLSKGFQEGVVLGKIIHNKSQSKDKILVLSPDFKKYFEVFTGFYADRKIDYQLISRETLLTHLRSKEYRLIIAIPSRDTPESLISVLHGQYQETKIDQFIIFDTNMTFYKDFVKDLTKPIIEGKTIGTFSKNEFVANKNDIWSKCWNVNRGWQNDRLFSKNSPDTSPVFRAISKKEFDKVKGFDSHGEYTDDWSLSEKLNKKAILAKDAIYYHSNPSTLIEVWKQAKWFSTNKFISGNLWRKVKSLVFYSLPMSLIIGLFKGVKSKTFTFVLFKIWFDLAVWHTVLKALFTSKKILK